MRIFSKPEVFIAIQASKKFNEDEGRATLTRFGELYPSLQQVMFAGFPEAIAQQSQDMAHLFMDLCFEIICVYEKLLGEAPKNTASPEELLNLLQHIMGEITAAKKSNLANTQQFLLEYLNLATDEHAKSYQANQDSVKITKNFLFTITRLFDDLYEADSTRH